MDMKYIFGPVPSRRLGESLGISPIPAKTCNYSCVYCQLGRTNKMSNKIEEFYEVEDIVNEFDFVSKSEKFDVVTIVGEGEPTLYKGLGKLINELKLKTKKPIAVITNGALLYDKKVRENLMNADIVLPSLDYSNEDEFRNIDRPYGALKFYEVFNGLVTFSKEYKGQLWIEIMLVKGINDSDESLKRMKKLLQKLNYDRIYINTPVRPPAEEFVKPVSKECLNKATEMFDATSIEMLASGNFYSEEEDSVEAIIKICRRHPMNAFEVSSFLDSRKENNKEQILNKLKNDSRVTVLDYRGILTYRSK